MTVTLERPVTAEPLVTRPVPVVRKHRWEQIALVLFVTLPFAALLLGVPLLWSHSITPLNIGLAVAMYVVAGHGITVGFHRYFTHGSFKANRGLRVGLAVAGSLAVQGPVTQWVADHRKHHAFSDQPGDPHSPHRYGEGVAPMLKGLWHAHMGWLFDMEQTPAAKYAPDLLADHDIRRIGRLFPAFVAISLLLPAVIGGLVTWSITGALSALFWAGLVRVAFLHHVTWSINSVCHTFGRRPFATRDQSTNCWPLAVVAMGENWHNLHHAEPTAARHGVERGQIDSTAWFIRLFERLGWATDVRWPQAERLAARRQG